MTEKTDRRVSTARELLEVQNPFFDDQGHVAGPLRVWRVGFFIRGEKFTALVITSLRRDVREVLMEKIRYSMFSLVDRDTLVIEDESEHVLCGEDAIVFLDGRIHEGCA